MRLWLSVFVGLAMSVAACDRFRAVQGNGHPRTEQRPVTTFEQVQVSGGLTATIIVGSAPSLTLTADDNLLPMITSQVDHGQLQLRTTQSISSVTPIQIQVTVPTLRMIDVGGGVHATVTGVDSPSFEIHASGGSNVVVGGRAPQLTASLSGGVQLDADGLIAERVRIDGSGGVRASVFASQQLDGSMSGGAMLDVHGDPTIRRVSSSAAAIVNYR